MASNWLMRMKGKTLSFLKYNKQRIFRTPRYLFTQRVKSFIKQGKDLNIPVSEAKEIQKFLRWNLAGAFNAPFVYSYNFRSYRILKDKETDLWFTYTSEGKKLYFKRGLSRKQVLNAYRALEKEQDVCSPHCYFFDGLNLSENSVVADIGVAEGNFGLKIVDHIKELYLFECDADWIEALQLTFAPWKDKVHIINRFVSDTNSDDTVRIDDFYRDKNVPDILKLDVEGAESSVLDGAATLLKSGCISELLVCTYHKKDDEKVLAEKLENLSYSITFSQGYMLFPKEGYETKPPYDFRKGLLHATRA